MRHCHSTSQLVVQHLRAQVAPLTDASLPEGPNKGLRTLCCHMAGGRSVRWGLATHMASSGPSGSKCPRRFLPLVSPRGPWLPVTVTSSGRDVTHGP